MDVGRVAPLTASSIAPSIASSITSSIALSIDRAVVRAVDRAALSIALDTECRSRSAIADMWSRTEVRATCKTSFTLRT